MPLTGLQLRSIALSVRDFSHGYWEISPRPEASASDFNPAKETFRPFSLGHFHFIHRRTFTPTLAAIFDENMPPKPGRLIRSVDEEVARLWTSQPLAE